jgi:sulfotransferase
MEKMFFMGGVNRSGATLLGSILNQNPDIYVNCTSPLVDLCLRMEQTLLLLDEQYTFDRQAVFDNIMPEMHKLYFKNIDKKYIIDNSRSWPGNITAIKKHIDLSPKIICTYRPIPEVITSFLALDRDDPDNALRFVLNDTHREINTKNLAQVAWDVMTKATWESLKLGLRFHPENILLIHYHDITNNPDEQVKRVYDFLEIPSYEHHYDNIVNTLNDPKDYNWGFRNLHNIRTNKVSKVSLDPKEVLGEELYNYYSKFDQLLLEETNADCLRR